MLQNGKSRSNRAIDLLNKKSRREVKIMTKANKKGFTLIEIVIVLAIAALIMVIVFLAIAGAQRARRDTAMKDAAAKLLAASEQYAGNTNGQYPTSALAASYTTNVSGNTGANLSYGTGPAASGTIFYANKQVCNAANDAMTSSSNQNDMAVLYWSESASKGVCITNH